ncbi:MAG: zinc ribbon domain-containing protein [Kiritimatiellae bacterium]|nr:zinc ribbon domain-containing protein [Kiritimatiellia bacterium]
MNSVVKCSACGAPTPLGRVFCMKCGAKLDHNNLRRAGGSDVGRQIFRALRLVLALALLLALVQMVRTVPQKGRIGTSEDAQRFLLRLQHLDSGIVKGQQVEEIVSEAELNAYFQVLVSRSRGRGDNPASISADLLAINAQLSPDTLAIVWRTKIGALPLTYEATCQPAAGESGLQWNLKRVRMGHLPLPRVVAEWTLAKWVRMFDNMTHERALLNALTHLSIAEDHAIARVGGSR